MEEVKLRPWAKINLYLEVLGRYDDGYHHIRTLIQPIGLFDELNLRRVNSGLQIKCEKGNIPQRQILPKESENLIGRAAELFFSKINETPSVGISLIKNIPIGGGLGGGSSDAASTLLGLNKLWGYPLKDKVIMQLAKKLGKDVPCFLEPKLTFCSGRGDVIEKRIDNERAAKFFCVLVNPGKELSTASVYKTLSLSLTEKQSRVNILPAFNNIPNINNIIKYINNDLEDTAIRLFPELNNILIHLRNAGVLKSFVCGSGSTVCGLLATESSAHAVVDKIREEEISKNWWIRIVSTL